MRYINQLTYLQAVIEETQLMTPLVGISQYDAMQRNFTGMQVGNWLTQVDQEYGCASNHRDV